MYRRYGSRRGCLPVCQPSTSCTCRPQRRPFSDPSLENVEKSKRHGGNQGNFCWAIGPGVGVVASTVGRLSTADFRLGLRPEWGVYVQTYRRHGRRRGCLPACQPSTSCTCRPQRRPFSP
ncbi:hypothetical protein TrispH2_009529 [Trichoplax sp. H2]|nr:hypothetical protein TrispH2_009529 [Trichoplax sp. H2]|eukprot:RDD38911.1 hypothetical protein TrispH2_009529 [Trichoplax sp. H2]